MRLAGCGSQDGVNAKNASPGDVATKLAPGHNTPDPGRWRWTSKIEKMDIAGLLPDERDAIGKPTIVLTCVTSETAGQVHVEAFQKGMDGCTYDYFTMHRGVLDAGLTCVQGGRQDKMAMTGTYSPADYQITTNSRVEIRPGVAGEAIRSLEGMRVGECDGSENK
jgi:hypothetical protein